ncbi:MAG: DUF4012 domain-containing protein [Patescibacteria group bacterium]
MPDEQHPNFLTCPAMPELTEGGVIELRTQNLEPRTRSTEPVLETPKGPGFPWGKATVLFGIPLLLIVGFLTAPAIVGGTRAGTAALRAESALKQAQASALAQEFQEADDRLAEAEWELLEVRAGLRATGPWRQAPWVGSKIRALEEVERAGSSVVGGLRDLLFAAISIQDALRGASPDGLGVASDRSYNDLTKEEKRAVVSRLAESLPRLRTAREKIAIATDAWNRVPQDELFAPIRNALAPLAAQLPTASRQLDEAVSILEIAIPILGYPAPKSYLVLLQNADEMRPTGGFIGTVGVMRVDAGDLEHIEFEDVYAVDGPVETTWTETPPPIMRRELGIPAWFLRDANWSPDVPESAARIMDFYLREMKQGRNIDVRLDGVIALQPELFRRLLLLTGPITVEDKTFTAENFFDQLQYDVEQGFFLEDDLPVAQRKEIVSKVGDALIEKLTSQPAARWASMLDIVASGLERKDVLVYSADASLQHLVDARGWGGRTLGTDGDEVWVIDANLAALKTDGIMEKRIFYSVDATDPAGPVATVRLRYANTNTRITWRYTRYRSYTRVYVPEGSELLSWSGGRGTPDVTRELGKQVYGLFWVIEPGRTGELVFRYRLPSRISEQVASDMYTLLVQKQPGAETKLTLDLRFGKTVQRAFPGEEESEFGDDRYRYETDLLKNETFNISF